MSGRNPLTGRREPVIFELSSEGKHGADFPRSEVPRRDPAQVLGGGLLRDDRLEGLPRVSETEVVRHFTRLSQLNYGIDTGFYPLGSCTMKHNPRISEEAARRREIVESHPYLPGALSQGVLEVMETLERCLAEITGLKAVSLQPAAGAHGELTGMLLIRAYHDDRGDEARQVVLIPDSAHGTNPSSANICGYKVRQVPSGPDGRLDLGALKGHLDESVAGLMLTNPNTLGIFETEVREVCEAVHEAGGLVYMDGANLNAIMGVVRPGETGVDVLHLNLHKTFSTPHGGGGPGAGPVAVNAKLEPYLPFPRLRREGEQLLWDFDLPRAIGRVRAFYGNFAMALRALVYIWSHGPEGLREAAETAVLNANYLRHRLLDSYHLPYESRSLHEVVFSHKRQKQHGVNAMDIAKRLMDYGFHPPTVFFPLIVEGALMIEPTETESRAEMDAFVDAMKAIAREAREQPDLLHEAPTRTPLRRLDETRAARKPVLRWIPEE